MLKGKESIIGTFGLIGDVLFAALYLSECYKNYL